jgi:hypothetical protein
MTYLNPQTLAKCGEVATLLVCPSLQVGTSSGAGNMAGLDTECFIELKDKKHSNRDNVQKVMGRYQEGDGM